ncbi:hypothetical protein SCALM49S_08770 [Streptomyces californicus]
MRAAIDLTWNAVAAEVAAAAERAPEVESAVLPLRARISVRAGLGNLATGLRPPATGHDNPHYFDDAACVRACVLAVAHPGDPDTAADTRRVRRPLHPGRRRRARRAGDGGGAVPRPRRRRRARLRPRRAGRAARGHGDRPQRPPGAGPRGDRRQHLRPGAAPGTPDRRPRLQLRHRRRRDRPGRPRPGHRRRRPARGGGPGGGLSRPAGRRCTCAAVGLVNAGHPEAAYPSARGFAAGGRRPASVVVREGGRRLRGGRRRRVPSGRDTGDGDRRRPRTGQGRHPGRDRGGLRSRRAPRRLRGGAAPAARGRHALRHGRPRLPLPRRSAHAAPPGCTPSRNSPSPWGCCWSGAATTGVRCWVR